jgi:S1-C subfamily serine protease
LRLRAAVRAALLTLLLAAAAPAGAQEVPAAPAPEVEAAPSGWSRPGEERSGNTGWERTLDRVVPGVAALRVSVVRPFDTEASGVISATGFVVDAKQGLILTNRHVVKPGPVTAEAVFLNNEKVDLTPVWRDPVHDFGFFRYDPAAVRFMEPAEIALAPERARVGAEVRVVGNDSGEKLSILAGTLARLDREAPDYGPGRYSDHNTFYFQAASSTSGGSSGSPVVDRSGRAVALNAGASQRSSSSFYLPLDRAVRALRLLQQGRPVPRGTFQAVLRHAPYDELRRLGLRPETEARLRGVFPAGVGLLVVAQVIPGGPADGRLEPGDVLVSLAGRPLQGFVPFEAALDDAVGRSVSVEVERGGVPVSVDVAVQDLFEVTPSAYLESGGAVLHELSYHHARNHGVPARGVYVAWPGYAFGRAGIPARSVITDLDGQPAPDLASFEALLAARPDGAPLAVRFFLLSDPRVPRVAAARVDRRWFPMQRCERDDAAGVWSCRPSPAPPPPVPPQPASTRIVAEGPGPARELAPSLAFVEFHLPVRLDGVVGSAFSGAGLVVDAERGLVVVDRDTVPISLGDVELTFANAVRVPGRVVALHPEHDLAVVGYDPALLGDTPIRSARLDLEPLEPGEEVWLVALAADQRMVWRRTAVGSVEPLRLPPPVLPRFQDANLEVATVGDPLDGVGGALVDGRGRVRALWASFATEEAGQPRSVFAGIASELVAEMVAPLRAGQPFAWRSLGVELEPRPLAEARALGLPEAAAREVEARDGTSRRLLAVRRVTASTPAAELLEAGDLLLAVGEVLAPSFRDVERAAQAESVRLRVVRDGAEREAVVPTVALDPLGTSRALTWAGAVLQPTPLAASAQRGVPPEGVNVAGRWPGSPADRHGLLATRRIVQANGLQTPDLDAFLAAVQATPDRGSVRLRALDLEGRTEVLTLELDLRYWPTFELLRGPGGWERRGPVAPAAAGRGETALRDGGTVSGSRPSS